MLQNNDMTLTSRSLRICLLVSLVAVSNLASGQSPPSPQPTERLAPPTRDPNTPGYVTAKELPDGSIPPANADGNFILGPTHEIPPHPRSAWPRPRGIPTLPATSRPRNCPTAQSLLRMRTVISSSDRPTKSLPRPMPRAKFLRAQIGRAH